jgi:hypothetical protein
MNSAKPKHWKERYYLDIKSYKDVPGWINDAEFVYEEMVNQAKDGAHFVEIGVLLGQSTTRMAELIKASGKKIKFDAIDLFWPIKHAINEYEKTGHPKEFKTYVDELVDGFNLRIIDIIKHPLMKLGLLDVVNFITCDEKYAHGIYDDNSLDFLWIDGDHGEDIVYNDLVNFWPKMKSGGVIAGDDAVYDEVLSDVLKFSKEYEVDVEYVNTDGFNNFKFIKE